MTEAFSRATRLVWTAAGCPAPSEGDGVPIPPRQGVSGRCAMCGEGPASWVYDDAFSDNFRPIDAFNRMFPHAVQGAVLPLCAACVWCAKTLRLRCAAWIARPDGLWWIARRELLAHLLAPPEPPFVAAAPLYGCAHGGEAHGWRAWWPGETRPAGVEALGRLQSKHVAVYAAISMRRDRYPLQWDDSVRVMVDVALWTRLAHLLGEIAAALRAAGCGVTDCRDAMRLLRCPRRAPVALHARWTTLTTPLVAHQRAVWWPLLADLVPLVGCATRGAILAAAPSPPTLDPIPEVPRQTPRQLPLF